MDKQQGIQLELNFSGDKGNRFKDHIDNGSFTVLIEVHAPSGKTTLTEAAELYSELEYTVSSQQKLFAALAFSDRWDFPDAMDNISLASAICRMERDRHVIFLSGRNTSLVSMEEAASHALNEGFRNLVPVSGRYRRQDSIRALNSGSVFFTESISSLRKISESLGQEVFLGCTHNPYQYTPCSFIAQNAKFIKKMNCGAGFAITHFGWDLKKIQELHCSLARREKTFPVLSGYMMLTKDLAEEICAGRFPGISLSPDMQELLRRDAFCTQEQFEAAQLRRVQLHAAGAKFLGCSGIMLSGVEKAAKAAVILKKIREAMEEFSSFEDWFSAYTEYYGRLNMAPYPHQFYAFEKLLTKSYMSELPEVANVEIQKPSGLKDFCHNLSRKLFRNADTLPAAERHLTKKILAGCRSCSSCRLPQTDFICPELCPKKMANGPCGEVRADGSCCYTRKECVFAERVRYAYTEGDLPNLEDEIIEQAPRKS